MVPGAFLAAAISSFTDVMPVPGLAAMISGELVTLSTGCRSLNL